MPILLFAVWLIFNGRVTLELIIFGVVISGVIYYGCVKMLDYSIKKEREMVRMLPGAAAYLLLIIWEVIKANVQVARVILSPRATHTQHRLVFFHTPVETRDGGLILANSITLTPGTITAGMKRGSFCVHALDAEFARGLDSSVFVTAIRKMEEKRHG